MVPIMYEEWIIVSGFVLPSTTLGTLGHSWRTKGPDMVDEGFRLRKPTVKRSKLKLTISDANY